METTLKDAAVTVDSSVEDIRHWRAKMGSVEWWMVAAVGVMGVLYGVNAAKGAREVQARRAALLAESAAEAATLGPREAEILDLTRGWMVETATAEASAFAAPVQGKEGSLASLLGRNGLYFRGASTDLTKASAIPEAIRTSVKDSLSLCLLSPPSTSSDVAMTVTALLARPGSRDLDAATPGMARLWAVQRGFRVLGAGWAEEVKGADGIGLRAFEAEFAERTDAARASAKGWSAASYFVAVVDELPEGMRAAESGSKLAASFETSQLPAVQKKAHEVRIAVFDMETKAPVLRVRRRVDPPGFAARTGLELDDAILAADCEVGSQVRLAGDKAAR